MRVGAGHSDSAHALEAIRAALGGAMAGEDAADLVFLFATYHYAAHMGPVLEAAVEIAGTENVVGCSGFGVLSGEGEIERGPGMTALALSGAAEHVVPFLVQGEGAGTEIGERILPAVSEDSVLVLLPDIHFDPTALIDRVQEVAGKIPVVGGAASGDPVSHQTLQWCGRNLAQQGVAGVLLSGGVRAHIGVAQGCQPFGQAYTITKAEGKIIREIAFGPPVDALKEALDTLTPEEKENVGRNIFVGLAMDEYATSRSRGDFLVRHILGLDSETGALAVAEDVLVGQTVQFTLRTAGAAHEDLEQVMAGLAAGLGGSPPRFGLYFNCLGRGFGLYGQPDHDVSVIQNRLGALPMTGFFGNAEIAPVGRRNFVHNYTGALVVFTDAEEEAP